MNMSRLFIPLIILCFGFSNPSIAAPHGDSIDKGSKSMHGSGGKHKKSSKGGTFSPHWAKTLSDEQRISFDKMHLQVGQLEAVQRAKMKMLNAELNVIAATKSKNKKAIYNKIDEILAVKKVIMRNRFDHITEMRNELTDQQKISYDMGILKRGKGKHNH